MQVRSFKDLIPVDPLLDWHFNDLVPFRSWGASLVGITAGLSLSVVLFGLWWPYWRIADMDLWMVYEGLLLNDGLPQEWFDHPGYLSILLLGHWFGVLHSVGLLDVHSLSELPAPLQAGDAWTAAVRAGRVLSLQLAVAFVLAFGILLRRLVEDWRVAAAATFMLAFSGGIALEARIIRTELIAGGLAVIALLILLNAARSATPWRPLLIGLAALLATLGMTNKVQVIFLLSTFPLLVLPFGRIDDNPARFWRQPARAFAGLALIAVAAGAASIPALPLLWFGLTQGGTSAVLWGPLGPYQQFIAIWIATGVVGYAITWRIAPLETLATLFAVAGGIALGLMSLDIRYHPQDVLVVVNPLDQLLLWASALKGGADLGGVGETLRAALRALYVVFATRTFVLDSSARPTIFLEWLVVAGTAFAWKTGYRRLAIQVALLLGTVWGMDALFTFGRSLQMQYFTFTDPLMVIAAALLVANLKELRYHRRVGQVGIALIGVHLVLSQSEPVKKTFLTSKPLEFCAPHFAYTKRIESFSYCP